MSNFRQHIKDNPLEELKIFSGKFISIGLLVKYPERFEEYHVILKSIAMILKTLRSI